MRLTPLQTLAGLLAFAFASSTGHSEELVNRQTLKSPDGRKVLTETMWIDPNWGAPRVDLELKEGTQVLYRKSIPPEEEAHYVKLSWAPSSTVALIAVNFKSVEDWILIQIAAGKATATDFDGDSLVMKLMLQKLPFRKEIQSIAPVARVPWKTVRWDKTGRCTADYIFRGIGHEGTAQLLFDFQHAPPTLAVPSIIPTTDPKLWDQD